MRLLQLHSDFIEYEPVAMEIKDAEDNVSKSKVRLEDLVVVLIAIENDDDESVASIAAGVIIKAIENIARESIDEVHKAPFGWTKAFDIKVKGHPLAENAKVLTKQQSSFDKKSTSDTHEDVSTDDCGISIATNQSEKVSSAL